MDNVPQSLTIIDVFAQNMPLILSTLVSLVAVLATVYQSHNQRKMKISELYFEAQLKAYTEFYNLVIGLDCDLEVGGFRDLRPLHIASKTAALVSPHKTAEIISNFCAVYREYLSERDSGRSTKKTDEDFQDALYLVETMLREEIFLHSSQRRRTDKIFSKRTSGKG